MARVKRAVNAQKKRRTVLETASGYRGQRSRLYRKAKEQMLHSMQYAYRDRRDRKGDFRQLWITRINAAARANGMTYNRLIQGLRLAGVEVDRKILAELAVSDAKAFAGLVEVGEDAPSRRCLSRGLTHCLSDPGLGRRSPRGRPGLLLPGACSAAATGTTTGRFLAEGPQAVREALAAGAVIELFGTADALRPPRRAGLRRAPSTGQPVDRRRAWRRWPRPSSRRASSPSAGSATCPWPTRCAPRRGWSPSAPASATPATPARSCAPPTPPARPRSCSPGTASTRTTASAVRASAGSLFHVDVVRGRDARRGRRRAARRRAAGARRRRARRRGSRRAGRRGGLAGRPRGCSAPRRTACPPTLGRGADARVRVPIHGRAESLNLAAAAAVCLYASARASVEGARS